MSLFGMLGATARALEAQRFGLDVVGNNLANVNTPGYTKRVADLGAVAPVDRFSAGSGVEMLGVRAMRDRLYDRRLFDELPLEQYEAATADAAGLAEVALGSPGTSIDNALADFFDAFAGLADAPASSTARQQVVTDTQALAASFKGMASRLDESAAAADTRLRGEVERLNALTERLASLNASIATSPVSQTLQLRDQQIEVAKELSGILGTQVVEIANGTLQVTTRTGRPLVLSDTAYPVTASSTPPQGYATLQSNGVDITADITDGRIGGLLQVRDTLIPTYKRELDTLAYGVATAVNTVHATGYDLTGASGGALFVRPGAVAGAAAALTVNAAVVANPSLLAAAAVASPGDNGVARQLANLRDGAIVNGTTPAAAWTSLVYRVGADVNRAETERDSRTELVQQIELLRDSVSGVSIDEEAAMMMRFQRAYEANARFFTVIDETIETLLSLKR